MLFAGQVESSQQNSGGGSDRDDLLSAIRKGAQLKSVSICFLLNILHDHIVVIFATLWLHANIQLKKNIKKIKNKSS